MAPLGRRSCELYSTGPVGGSAGAWRGSLKGYRWPNAGVPNLGRIKQAFWYGSAAPGSRVGAAPDDRRRREGELPVDPLPPRRYTFRVALRAAMNPALSTSFSALFASLASPPPAASVILNSRRVCARPASNSDPVRRHGPERGSTGGGGRPRSFPSGPRPPAPGQRE